MKVLRLLPVYAVLVLVCGLLGAMVWHLQMPGAYFICHHRGIILDFLPPFVHAGADGDFFMRPAYVVYTFWGIYVGVALVLPAFALWIGGRIYERDLKKSWR